MVGGAGHEGLVGEFPCEPVHHAGFGEDDEGVGRVVATEGYHFLGAAYLVGEVANGLDALGVGDHGGVGILDSATLYGLLGKEDVGVTTARPKLHWSTGVLSHPLTEVLVGDEEDFLVGRHLLDDFHGVSAGANDVAEGLYGCRAVYVGDDVHIGVFLAEGGQFFRRAGIGKGAPRVDVGKQDGFPRIENFRRLSHEVDAAKDDDLGVGFGGLVGEPEGVSNVVGDLLYGFDLVVVAKDYRVAFLLEP